jgi:hypothetical protein
MKGRQMLNWGLPAPWVWRLAFACPFLFVFALTGFDYPLHGDEATFYPITIQFSARALPPVQLLRSYEQSQTPLMFFVFGLVGRAVGFDLWKLRVGVALLSYLTLLLFFHLCRASFDSTKPWLSIYATAALALSPYYLGTSLYYYSDIPCLFAMMVALTLYLSGRPLGGAIAAGAALLTRQYSVFLPVAYALTSIMMKERRPWRDLRRWTMLVLPFAMLVPLIVLWKGISPQNHLRESVRQAGYVHPEFVNYLVLATGVYSLPLAILRTREIFQRQRLLTVGLLTPLFWLAIPRPNPEVMNPQVRTLGYLDIALSKTFGDHKTIPYFLLWMLGCLILYEVFQIERYEANKLILFAIVGFFLMHLFAPSVWDKYLLMVLPLVFLSLVRGHAKPVGFASAPYAR